MEVQAGLLTETPPEYHMVNHIPGKSYKPECKVTFSGQQLEKSRGKTPQTMSLLIDCAVLHLRTRQMGKLPSMHWGNGLMDISLTLFYVIVFCIVLPNVSTISTLHLLSQNYQFRVNVVRLEVMSSPNDPRKWCCLK